MEFETITLEPGYVAGLAIPLAGREVSRKDLDLVNFTWDRYLSRGKTGVRVAAYVAQDGRSTAVLGYEVKGLEEVEPGDVITRIPTGRYAKFTVSGQPYDLTRTAWANVAKAEAEGLITRSHTLDLERFISADAVEVYVSVS